MLLKGEEMKPTDWKSKNPGQSHQGNVSVNDTNMARMGKVSLRIFGIIFGDIHVVDLAMAITTVRNGKWEKAKHKSAGRF